MNNENTKNGTERIGTDAVLTTQERLNEMRYIQETSVLTSNEAFAILERIEANFAKLNACKRSMPKTGIEKILDAFQKGGNDA